MALLDFVVRPEGARPPVAAVAGAPYLAWLVAELLLSHLIWMPRWGYWGFALHLVVAGLDIFADGLLSNSFGYNVLWLRANGFSDAQTAATILFNLVASQSLGFLVTYFLWTEPFPPETLARVFSWPVLVALLTNMAIGEVLFTLAHRYLHQHQPELQRMHHCCRRASWSTNLIFHPVDLALEFAGPVASILATHFLLWKQDQLVLIVSYLVLQTWYALDHDEYLRLYHYAHHLSVDAVYTIYVKVRDDPSRDLVRKILVKPAALAAPAPAQKPLRQTRRPCMEGIGPGAEPGRRVCAPWCVVASLAYRISVVVLCRVVACMYNKARSRTSVHARTPNRDYWALRVRADAPDREVRARVESLADLRGWIDGPPSNRALHYQDDASHCDLHDRQSHAPTWTRYQRLHPGGSRCRRFASQMSL